MNEPTQVRLALAQRNAEAIATDPRVKGVLVVGSVAKGYADHHSDIDTSIYYEALPSEAEFNAICERAIASGGGVFGGTASEGFAVYEYIDGIRCDFGHILASEAEAEVRSFLQAPTVDDNNTLIKISGLHDGVPLAGAAWIDSWRCLLNDYPPSLAEALLKKHLRFYPRWILEKLGIKRGDQLFLYEALLEGATNVFGVLCGLNRLYHPGKIKGMAWSVAKMKQTPPNLMARLDQIFSVEPAEAVDMLHRLIPETLTLVETYMPEVSTQRVRTLLSKVADN
jgi:hypothetical protein